MNPYSVPAVMLLSICVKINILYYLLLEKSTIYPYSKVIITILRECTLRNESDSLPLCLWLRVRSPFHTSLCLNHVILNKRNFFSSLAIWYQLFDATYSASNFLQSWELKWLDSIFHIIKSKVFFVIFTQCFLFRAWRHDLRSSSFIMYRWRP